MKNKLFLPLSFLHVVLILLVGGMFVGGFYVIFYYLFGVILPEETVMFQETIELVFLLTLGVGVVGYYLIRELSIYIVFKKEYVYTPMQLIRKKHRIQYATKILYKDIKSIELISSNKNSKNRTYSFEGHKASGASAYYNPYIEITTYDDKKERILILFHSRRQWVKMLDEFKKRLEQCGNVIEMQDSKEMAKNLKNVGWEFSWKEKTKKKKKK